MDISFIISSERLIALIGTIKTLCVSIENEWFRIQLRPEGFILCYDGNYGMAAEPQRLIFLNSNGFSRFVS